MAKRKGIGNVHTHHLDLRCLPENLTVQQSGFPESMEFLTGLRLVLSRCQKRFLDVMSGQKEYSEVSRFHIQDMNKANIDYSVVLHIDLEGADPKAKDKNYQYEYVTDKIAQACALHPFRFFPFFGFDPRRPNVLKMLEINFRDRCYVGIKLYPALGFDPRPDKASYKLDDGDYFEHEYHEYLEGGKIEGNEILENLKGMYKFASEHKIPLLTHCSPNGSYRVTVDKKEKYENIWRYTNPSNFRDIAKTFGLRICLGHMGGKLDEKENRVRAVEWNGTIFSLIREANDWASEGRLFADQSFDIINLINGKEQKEQLEVNIQMTKNYLNDISLGRNMLFGSDWPLNIYKCTEKQYIDEYRKRLDTSQQEKYFSDNTASFLFGESRKIPQNYVDYVKEHWNKEKGEFVIPDWIEEINGEYFLVK